MKSILGDIGGTNTRMIYQDLSNSRIIYSHNKLSNDYNSIFELIDDFINSFNITDFKIITLSLASPMECSIIKLNKTKLSPFTVQELKDYYKCDVCCMNDLEAASYGVSQLEQSNIQQIPVRIDDNQYIASKETNDFMDTKLIIAPGTGLGASLLVQKNNQPLVVPLELAFCQMFYIPEHQELIQFIEKKNKKNVLENICQGNTIRFIYEYLTKEETTNEMNQIITDKYVDNDQGIYKKCIEIFIELLQYVIGSCVCIFKPKQGVYLCGTILSKIYKRNPNFINLFNKNKKELNMLYQTTPFYIINELNQNLEGCKIMSLNYIKK